MIIHKHHSLFYICCRDAHAAMSMDGGVLGSFKFVQADLVILRPTPSPPPTPPSPPSPVVATALKLNMLAAAGRNLPRRMLSLTAGRSLLALAPHGRTDGVGTCSSRPLIRHTAHLTPPTAHLTARSMGSKCTRNSSLLLHTFAMKLTRRLLAHISLQLCRL